MVLLGHSLHLKVLLLRNPPRQLPQRTPVYPDAHFPYGLFSSPPIQAEGFGQAKNLSLSLEERQ